VFEINKQGLRALEASVRSAKENVIFPLGKVPRSRWLL